MAIAGRKGLIKVSGSAVGFTDEACSTSDNTIYQITDTAKRIWDRSVSITVKDGGVPTVESYTVNRLTGTITFGSASARTITVSGDYLPVSTAANCKSFTLSLIADNAGVPSFQDTFRVREQQLKDASGSLSEWKTTDVTFATALQAGAPVVLELYPDSSGSPFRVWALLNKQDLSAALEKPQEESVSFEGSADADGNVVALVA